MRTVTLTPGPIAGVGAADARDAADEVDVPRQLLLAFAPIHKRALGIAVGTVSALTLFGLTAFHVIVRPPDALNLWLLQQYFYGYTVTWGGAFLGAAWGFFTGFVGGWFLAFCRNFAIAASLFFSRTAAELDETRDFLDHI